MKKVFIPLLCLISYQFHLSSKNGSTEAVPYVNNVYSPPFGGWNPVGPYGAAAYSYGKPVGSVNGAAPGYNPQKQAAPGGVHINLVKVQPSQLDATQKYLNAQRGYDPEDIIRNLQQQLAEKDRKIKDITHLFSVRNVQRPLLKDLLVYIADLNNTDNLTDLQSELKALITSIDELRDVADNDSLSKIQKELKQKVAYFKSGHRMDSLKELQASKLLSQYRAYERDAQRVKESEHEVISLMVENAELQCRLKKINALHADEENIAKLRTLSHAAWQALYEAQRRYDVENEPLKVEIECLKARLDEDKGSLPRLENAIARNRVVYDDGTEDPDIDYLKRAQRRIEHFEWCYSQALKKLNANMKRQKAEIQPLKYAHIQASNDLNAAMHKTAKMKKTDESSMYAVNAELAQENRLLKAKLKAKDEEIARLNASNAQLQTQNDKLKAGADRQKFFNQLSNENALLCRVLSQKYDEIKQLKQQIQQLQQQIQQLQQLQQENEQLNDQFKRPALILFNKLQAASIDLREQLQKQQEQALEQLQKQQKEVLDENDILHKQIFALSKQLEDDLQKQKEVLQQQMSDLEQQQEQVLQKQKEALQRQEQVLQQRQEQVLQQQEQVLQKQKEALQQRQEQALEQLQKQQEQALEQQKEALQEWHDLQQQEQVLQQQEQVLQQKQKEALQKQEQVLQQQQEQVLQQQEQVLQQQEQVLQQKQKEALQQQEQALEQQQEQVLQQHQKEILEQKMCELHGNQVRFLTSQITTVNDRIYDLQKEYNENLKQKKLNQEESLGDQQFLEQSNLCRELKKYLEFWEQQQNLYEQIYYLKTNINDCEQKLQQKRQGLQKKNPSEQVDLQNHSMLTLYNKMMYLQNALYYMERMDLQALFDSQLNRQDKLENELRLIMNPNSNNLLAYFTENVASISSECRAQLERKKAQYEAELASKKAQYTVEFDRKGIQLGQYMQGDPMDADRINLVCLRFDTPYPFLQKFCFFCDELLSNANYIHCFRTDNTFYNDFYRALCNAFNDFFSIINEVVLSIPKNNYRQLLFQLLLKRKNDIIVRLDNLKLVQSFEGSMGKQPNFIDHEESRFFYTPQLNRDSNK
ncbi:hypothetical protein [Candidatus Gromoviella agglomerans]|uniref:hypothetical protein n=1 Tax=Candidatus Gromoviella agglomerans TaxID=2806609 RepID=UPI001E4D8926|nr:hypothetical protein [Candidatus Gromoviella agglomerans]UFX98246.1 Smc super family protein [Candidatus Gromoviella agglomerans]